MFTGIIEEVGKITSVIGGGGGKRLEIGCSFSQQLSIDDSVAVNGVCLTVVAKSDNAFEAVAIEETLAKSSLGSLDPGHIVNLERAMVFGGRVDGHIVQGHVDGTGRVVDIEKRGSSHEIVIEHDTADHNMLIPKGSVTLDGISLTVAGLETGLIKVAIIPHTFENTNVRTWQRGTVVNIEFDMIGKYVVRYLDGLGDRKDKVSGISKDWLQSKGF